MTEISYCRYQGGKSKRNPPVITATLGTQHMPQSPGHPAGELTALQDRSRQHRIRWGQTGTDNQSSGPVGFHDGIDEASSDQPAVGHDRQQHHGHTGPMPGEVGLGQLHTDGEDLETHDDTGGFLGDGIGPAP